MTLLSGSLDPAEFEVAYLLVPELGLANGVGQYRSGGNGQFGKATAFVWQLQGENGGELVLDSIGPQDVDPPLISTDDWYSPLDFQTRATVVLTALPACSP